MPAAGCTAAPPMRSAGGGLCCSSPSRLGASPSGRNRFVPDNGGAEAPSALAPAPRKLTVIDKQHTRSFTYSISGAPHRLFLVAHEFRCFSLMLTSSTSPSRQRCSCSARSGLPCVAGTAFALGLAASSLSLLAANVPASSSSASPSSRSSSSAKAAASHSPVVSQDMLGARRKP